MATDPNEKLFISLDQALGLLERWADSAECDLQKETAEFLERVEIPVTGLGAKSKDPKAKLRSSLDLLEKAQGLVNEAACELSSVDGYADQWSEICKLYDTVKEHWYLVDRRRIELQPLVEEGCKEKNPSKKPGA